MAKADGESLMRKTIRLVTCACCLTVNAAAAGKVKSFSGNRDQVFQAAIKAASQPAWTIDNLNGDQGIIHFTISFDPPANGKGVQCNAKLQDLMNGTIEVSVNTEKRFGMVG